AGVRLVEREPGDAVLVAREHPIAPGRARALAARERTELEIARRENVPDFTHRLFTILEAGSQSVGSANWLCCSRGLGNPLPLRERVDASGASGRVRGLRRSTPHPARPRSRARHPLPQGERVTERAARAEIRRVDL